MATTVDRVDRRHDSTHGRGHVLQPGRAADGTRAVQVPGAEFPPSAHRKGRLNAFHQVHTHLPVNQQNPAAGVI